MSEKTNPPNPVPNRESVWDYPRPPALERTDRRIRVMHRGVVIADSTRSWRVLETSHPPGYYLPPEDIRMDLMKVRPGESFCEWKGRARYFDLVMDDHVVQGVAWSYPDPTPRFKAIHDHLSFYPGRVDRCLVDDETVQPQPGDFYGGWITTDLIGPFKGEPGSMGW